MNVYDLISLPPPVWGNLNTFSAYYGKWTPFQRNAGVRLFHASTRTASSGFLMFLKSCRYLCRVNVALYYRDVIMSTMASAITSLTIVCRTIYSGADQRKHQSSASLAFVRGIHWWPVNSPHKWPVRRKIFPFNGVIMVCMFCYRNLCLIKGAARWIPEPIYLILFTDSEISLS